MQGIFKMAQVYPLSMGNDLYCGMKGLQLSAKLNISPRVIISSDHIFDSHHGYLCNQLMLQPQTPEGFTDLHRNTSFSKMLNSVIVSLVFFCHENDLFQVPLTDHSGINLI